MVGIYCILNLKNNKMYIGQSIDVESRLKKHKYQLDNNKHFNSYLQNSFNKYGKNNFKYLIIEECNINQLNEREIYWISKNKSNNIKYGYNRMSGGGSRHSFSHSEETKRKISQSQIGRVSPNKGKTMSEDQKIKLSLKHIGKNLSLEHKQKISLKNKNKPAWNKGKNGIECKKTTFNSAEIKLMKDLKTIGLTYKSIGDFFNCDRKLISKILNNEFNYVDNKKFKNAFPLTIKIEGGYEGPTKNGFIQQINSIEDVEMMQKTFNDYFEKVKEML